MKTAISIPDDVFADAERLRRRFGKTRSQLYTEALREYLARHDADLLTEALNQMCDRIEPRIDPFVDAAARELLQRVEW